jgi:hypothetical protein
VPRAALRSSACSPDPPQPQEGKESDVRHIAAVDAGSDQAPSAVPPRIRQARLEYTAQALSAAELSFEDHWASVQAMLAAAVAEVQRLDHAGREHADDQHS